WADQRIFGELDFANWPYYIDRTRDNSHPSLDLFTAETGIAVDYVRPIRDNAAFLELIRPALEVGEPTGYDIIVISNGPELTELISSGWATPLDHTRLPHFEQNAGPLVRDPVWDPGNRYTLSWQSGLTGIAYTPEAVTALGREPTSFEDMWDPALAGKVGMMSDLVELGSAGLLAIGVDPSVSTVDNWTRAAERLLAQRDATQPRFYDQGYVDALSRRDTWITMAWSGDIFQLSNLGQPDLRFVVPAEGAMFWTDNMLIPANSLHPLDALTYMDFVYRAGVAAMIANWVWYICPVPAAEEIVRNELDNPEVARSPLVFPGEGIIGHAVGGGDGGQELLGSRVRNYFVYEDPAEYAEWVSVFEPIVYG
ncbi:MAG TPA: spermidine/putrescine ABC transporter substrate-binding protein, partial [Actinomycetota bacterium]|nr:spermidine/putrescine ABC transporter substrate-binding protein [Actinomycetota bacterium]